MNNYSSKINNILEDIKEENKKLFSLYGEEIKVENKIEPKLSISTNSICKPLIDLRYRESKINKDNNVKSLTDEYNIDEISSFLDQEMKTIYFRSWSKLEMGLKLNRIDKYINKIVSEKNLSPEKHTELKSVLLEAFNKNKLNKKSEVDYNNETGEIIDIKYLDVGLNSESEYEILYKYPISQKKKKEFKKDSDELDKVKRLNKSDTKKMQKIYNSQKEILGLES
jgi:hypothetical protein